MRLLKFLILSIFFLSFIFVIFFQTNCDRASDWTSEPELVTEQQIIDSTLKIEKANSLIIENDLGSIMIFGESGEKELRWRLIKTVKARSRNKAFAHLDKILFSVSQDSEVIYVKTDLISPDSDLEYYCSFNLLMPYNLPCLGKKVNGSLYAEYLDSTLIVENAVSHIHIAKHSGNCDVSSQQGKIIIEIAFPDKGFCRATTKAGNIAVKVPKNVSAMVKVEAKGGSIKYTNLTFVGDVIKQGNELRGQLGNGKGEIALLTEKGDISIEGF